MLLMNMIQTIQNSLSSFNALNVNRDKHIRPMLYRPNFNYKICFLILHQLVVDTTYWIHNVLVTSINTYVVTNTDMDYFLSHLVA